ncbi:hypothetical protein [Acutalibacter caecimuris]|uniref:hypothetical protein n=1 Tax=Acutalibacter caecimuris TaxID=3093657 RepID=UPI002AC9AEA0|nr:hypothetical protein [Acutalibacter sp. M00118]
MFLWIEAGYQLFRNKGRSILLVCASLLLCGCIAFYLGTIDTNKKALRTLSQSTPATVRLSNIDGDEFDNLTLSYTFADGLVNRGVVNIRSTSQADGYHSEEAKAQMREGLALRAEKMEHPDPGRMGFVGFPLPDGDTSILGISRIEVLGVPANGLITWAEGYDESFLEGDGALCLITQAYADAFGLTLGDTFSASMCFVQYGTFRGKTSNYTSDPTWTVVGICSPRLTANRKADMYVPVNWLRKEVESTGTPFTYTSFEGDLADSMELNGFKEGLRDMGLGQPFFLIKEDYARSPPDRSAAKTLYMEDEDFIRTAEKLGQAIRQYEAFLIPFFIIVVFLVTLAIFLVLRGCRRDMAVACSLGRPKLLTGTATLLAALGAQLAGALLSVPVALFLTGISIGTALLVCGAFMLCALLGDVVGLLALLRFDALALLTAGD